LLASIRGRLGLAFDRVLVYGTGGWGYVSGKLFTSGAVAGNNERRYHKSAAVWGVGIEWAAANNLTYRIEALDFVGTKSVGPNAILDEVNRIKSTWEVRFGLNYKFDGSGWGKGPVYAKY